MTKLSVKNKKQQSWGDRKLSKSRKTKIFYPLLINLVIAFLVLFHSFHWLQLVYNDLNNPILSNTNQFKHASIMPPYVTIVMPSVVNKNGCTSRLNAITETWGPDANAIYILDEDSFSQFSNLPIFPHSISNNISNIPFPTYSFPMRLLIPSQIEESGNGFERLQFVIQTLSQHKFLTIQYFFFVNDHTFVIPDKLCHFLTHQTKSNSHPQLHLYAGHALKNQKNSFAFNSGASGYILSRFTLDSLVESWKQNDPNCILTGPNSNFLQANPGIVTAKCLQESFHVTPIDTRDTNKNHIFHAFGIIRTATKMVDPWYINKHEDLHLLLPNLFSIDYQHVFGDDGDSCSSDTISFHYVESYETKALYYIRQYIIDNPSLSDNDLKHILQNKWPDNKDHGWLGGYGKPLPKDDDIENWKAVLKTFRIISNTNSICSL